MAKGKSASAGIVWTDESLFKKMPVMTPAIDKMIGKVMEYEAQNAQDIMRSNAPWTDRTGNARQGLFARAGSSVSGPGRNAKGQFTKGGANHFIVLYHTMPYGFWLEVKNHGKYAIVEPTLQPTGMKVMRSLKDLFRLVDAVA